VAFAGGVFGALFAPAARAKADVRSRCGFFAGAGAHVRVAARADGRLDVAGAVLHFVLRRLDLVVELVADLARALRQLAASLLAACGREQQRHARADRGAEQERHQGIRAIVTHGDCLPW
jgi:hypothetical protein